MTDTVSRDGVDDDDYDNGNNIEGNNNNKGKGKIYPRTDHE
jgi:hypothetical protein